jgi:protein SCO1/2
MLGYKITIKEEITMKVVFQNMTSVTLALTVALVLSACGPSKKASDSSSKRYSVKGKVVSVDKQSHMVNVDAEAIPGFMEAMTMPYKVEPESVLEQLSPGDSISADLIVQAGDYWLENVKVTPHSNPPPR